MSQPKKTFIYNIKIKIKLTKFNNSPWIHTYVSGHCPFFRNESMDSWYDMYNVKNNSIDLK